MKEQILKIAEQLKYDEITTDYAQTLLLSLFGVSGSWVYVNEETPPTDIELLAKAPDGTIQVGDLLMIYFVANVKVKVLLTGNGSWFDQLPLTVA